MSALQLQAVSRTYGDGATSVVALQHVDVEVQRGELVAVMGPSGSGKSTLLTIAGTLEDPTSGEVRVGDVAVSGLSRDAKARLRRQSIGYVFQDYNLLAGLTASENVSLPLELDGVPMRTARVAAMAALDQLGLVDQRDRFPDELSGGERQRVAIAGAVVGDRQLLLADEPSGALDSVNGESVMRLIRAACRARCRRHDRHARRAARVVGRPRRVPARRASRRPDRPVAATGLVALSRRDPVTAVAATLPASSDRRGGAPARRAIVRWSFRMFRREWRRQALVIALLTVAVAATTVGLAVITNVAELHADPTFGTASTMIELSGSDQHLAADLTALRQRTGRIDVVAHQRVAVPGSVATLDIRAEDPHGAYVARTVSLIAGHYPTRAGQVALTRSVASLVGARVGGTWSAAGNKYTVVGTVENPLDLSDQFALVAPGALTAPTNIAVLTNASGSSLQNLTLPSGTGVGVDSRGTASKASIEAVILALATIGMLFVGLLAVAGFAVVAQRRMRAFGVLSSVGANDRSVRLVMLANGAAVGFASAVAGGVLGFLVWLGVYKSIESVVDHRIDPLALPWFAVILGLVLAFVTSVVAAWWPARAAARVPVVAALSGRPPALQPAHRFAAAGVLVLALGIVLLAFTDKRRAGFIIGGIIASVVGLLLLAPLAIQLVARLARHTPISIRLALRDLSRYQARSGAALGAATLAIAIAATIAISAAAAQTISPNPNLPANELVLYIGQQPVGPGPTVPVLDSSQTAAVGGAVKQIAASLHATALELDAPYNPAGPIQTPGQGPGDELGGRSTVSLAHVFPEGQGIEIDAAANLYVGTPAVLAQFGIRPSAIGTTSEFISSRTDLSKMSVFDPSLRSNRAPLVSSLQIVKQLPRDQSDPNVLITPYGMHKLGFAAMPDAWLFHAPLALDFGPDRGGPANRGVGWSRDRDPRGTEVVRSAPQLGNGRRNPAGARRARDDRRPHPQRSGPRHAGAHRDRRERLDPTQHHGSFDRRARVARGRARYCRCVRRATRVASQRPSPAHTRAVGEPRADRHCASRARHRVGLVGGGPGAARNQSPATRVKPHPMTNQATGTFVVTAAVRWIVNSAEPTVFTTPCTATPAIDC